ncbi:MAG: hypothetical protein CVV22_00720 [Ignavibacteriae bacterium HGW-Ignavibacteriae-1]|jgi:cytochrome c551/c552|nr:MAG: hypothetical protein CVV22_00720 [Ignavibacteriae bacterium HGW-Ignavibacteriae-1]
MEFLDKLVIPQPDYNLNLLNYFLILGLTIFLAYSGVLFGSMTLSVYFRNKSKKATDNNAKLSRDYADLITDNWIYSFGLGIVPLLSIIFIYTQLLHKQPVAIVTYLTIAFLFYLISLLLVHKYKKSLHLSLLFSALKNKVGESDEVSAEIESLNNSTNTTKGMTGTWSVVLLFISMWIFVGAVTFAMNPDSWVFGNSLTVLFSGASILKFLQFITAALAFTAISFVFRNLYWDAERKHYTEEYVEYAKNFNLWLALVTGLILPIFIVASLFIIPKTSLNPQIFAAVLLSLLLLLVILQQIYLVLKGNKNSFIRYAFYSFIVVFFLMAFIDKAAFSVGNRAHVLVLDQEYKVHKEEFLASLGIEAAPIDGAEIYTGRCAACHRDEDSPLAPAHKNIMQKYLDQADPLTALVQFIQNPTPVNPQWSPMPNQGLTPQEAQAVAEYMLEKYSTK